ncbi:MAG: sulfotransferase [Bacteroidales bacterium]
MEILLDDLSRGHSGFIWKREVLFTRNKIKNTQIDQAPVFIIGFWRSGTTFLHNLICQDPNHAFVTTYQSIFPHHCLVNSGWLKKLAVLIAPQRRPVDNVKLNMDWPQEEEMALGNIQPISFYNYFYFPDHFEEYIKESLLQENLSEKEITTWEKAYLLLIKKSLIISQGNRFVSKNPPSIFRIPQLLKMFPNAKFVYIYRNPYSVLSSFNPFMKQVIHGVGFQNVEDSKFDPQLYNLFKTALVKYEKDKNLIPKNNLVEIKYEDFKQNPLGTIEGIYSQFHLQDFSGFKPKLEEYINSQKHQKSGGHHIPENLVTFVQNNLSDYMNENGYDLNP